MVGARRRRMRITVQRVRHDAEERSFCLFFYYYYARKSRRHAQKYTYVVSGFLLSFFSLCFFLLRIFFSGQRVREKKERLFLERRVIEKFFDEIHVTEQHPPAAVTFQAQGVQGVTVKREKEMDLLDYIYFMYLICLLYTSPSPRDS